MGTTLLLICGSLRAGSGNAATLRTAAALAGPDVRAEVYGGLAELPHFDPDADVEPLHPAVAVLRSAIGAADGVLFCTPEYAGNLPGSFKNLLDAAIGGGELDGRPVAWVNVSVWATGAADAHASLRPVLGYAGARIVEPACVHVPVPRDGIGPDGLVAEAGRRAAIADAVAVLVAGAADR